MSEHDEKCQRCGEVGEDRRTLRMNCFYAMEELGLPFGEAVLFQAKTEDLVKVLDPSAITLHNGEKINITPGAVRTSGDLIPMQFYTLRVCKGCRADWMESIKAWFTADIVFEPVDSGIFVRRNGRNVEITEEEWRRENPGREPVRIPKTA